MPTSRAQTKPRARVSRRLFVMTVVLVGSAAALLAIRSSRKSLTDTPATAPPKHIAVG